MTSKTRARLRAAKPHPKVAAVGVGGAAVTVLVWASDIAHLGITPAVGAAMVTLVAFGAGWLKRAR